MQAARSPDYSARDTSSPRSREATIRRAEPITQAMRSLPTTPMNRALWVLGIAACLIMIFASTVIGLGLMVVGVVLYTAGRLAGMR